ncbi:MAG TPA: hypothetical protein DCZ01_07540 [Elusimicrobia bacterium]|nr:MAG: hypothetical protein A2X37_06430 [Elusimicrobia bacterium GWA2_66_18]OGR77912.1 MAG: hypothetical protein A2X40_09110 [Elusimicrobia bacterium GWC2_65_9]HAZ08358.1 hypothetical protein [Elusimicrobiota bacterium]
MRHPLSLLALAVALAVPALPADHKATAKSRPTSLPTWETVGESTWSWRAISFEDETGKAHPLWCRRDECAWNKKSTRPVNLYVLQREKTEYYDYRKDPEDLPVKSAKAYYTTFLSMYKLDVSQTPHRAVIPGASLAFDIHDVESRLPEGYIMIVPPPTQVAEDRPAADKALSEDELAALDNIKDPAGKTQKENYQAEIKGRRSNPILRRAAAKYRGLVPTPNAPAGTGALTSDELAKLPPDEASQYIKDVLAAAGDPDKLADAYKASRDKIAAAAAKKPDSSSNAVVTLDLKELDKSEENNLMKGERKTYKLNLKQARKKKDPAGIAAVIAEYRQKARARALEKTPTTVAEFTALTPAQKGKFCDDLGSASNDGFLGGYQVVAPAKTQVEKAADSDDSATGIFSGNLPHNNTVAAAPLPRIAKTEVDKLRQACADFLADKPRSQSKTNLKASIPPDPTKPGSDTEGGKKDEKKDPNKWLAVKTGAVGAIPGALVGTFFGPVGILVGAAIGFALFWGVSKLTKD